MTDPDGSEAASAAKQNPPKPKPKPIRPSAPRKLAATSIRSKKLGAATSNGDDRNDQ